MNQSKITNPTSLDWYAVTGAMQPTCAASSAAPPPPCLKRHPGASLGAGKNLYRNSLHRLFAPFLSHS